MRALAAARTGAAGGPARSCCRRPGGRLPGCRSEPGAGCRRRAARRSDCRACARLPGRAAGRPARRCHPRSTCSGRCRGDAVRHRRRRTDARGRPEPRAVRRPLRPHARGLSVWRIRASTRRSISSCAGTRPTPTTCSAPSGERTCTFMPSSPSWSGATCRSSWRCCRWSRARLSPMPIRARVPRDCGSSFPAPAPDTA